MAMGAGDCAAKMIGELVDRKKYLANERARISREKARQDPNYKANRAAKVRASRSKEPEKHRAASRASVYKISAAEARALRAKPACDICGSPPPFNRKLDIDHCHVTGRVRGALCNRCNRMIGLVELQRPHLAKALAYLNRK